MNPINNMEGHTILNNTIYKLSDLSVRRPPDNMTDVEWQEYFKFIRSNIEPSNSQVMIKHLPDSCHGFPDKTYKRVHRRKTQNDEYCDFINDMLKILRSGRVDYCYYVFQVTDLLKFEYDRLRSEYMSNEGCIKVWLEKPIDDN